MAKTLKNGNKRIKKAPSQRGTRGRKRKNAQENEEVQQNVDDVQEECVKKPRHSDDDEETEEEGSFWSFFGF